MIKLEIRSYYSSDVEVDSSESVSESMWFPLQLEIGCSGRIGADIFDAMVATPEGLRGKAVPDDTGALSVRGLLVFREFSWSSLRRTIDVILAQCQAETWEESVLRLQRFFFWEYESASDRQAQN
jgi:hypothetical protein